MFAWLFAPVAYAVGFRAGALWRTLRPVPFVLLSIVTLAITVGGGVALGRAIDALTTIEVSHPDG